jgi:hypothetical protein|tara:strand:- start:425 stop:1144 length:720 start_codon:yes stop_codon:yes gene_type:complete
MVTIAIHQPEHHPWLGFFKKMSQTDIFVFFDDVQYNSRGFQNRNYIKTNTGKTLLSIPVLSKFDSKINELKIDKTKNWQKKHKKSIITNYSKTEFFEEYKNKIEEIYEKEYEYLIELNQKLIKFFSNELKIESKIIFSSSLDLEVNSSKKILEICKKFNADKYISGIHWGLENLNLDEFLDNGIEIEFQKFIHPTYKQRHGPFIPNLSALDLILNEGNNGEKILRESKIEIIKNINERI